ncbi:MAG: hypothetical protein RR505_03980, partial [Raoultibacter sp.]
MQKTLMLVGVAMVMMCLVGLLMLSGCAPQGASDENAGEAQADNATTQVAWSSDSDCTSCHSTESSSMSDSAYLCATHEQQGQTCTSCHTDETALADVHENSKDLTKTATKLKKTEVDSSVCQSCHKPSDLQAATANLTLLTDENGTTVN